MNKYHLDYIDRTCKSLCKSNSWMGGKILILSGDFKQCLPVEKRKPVSYIKSLLITNTKLFQQVKKIKLTFNERVNHGSGDPSFAAFLLQVGNGTLPTFDETLNLASTCVPRIVKIPDDLITKSTSMEGFIKEIYPQIENSHTHFGDSCILTCLNKECDEINDTAINMKPGQLITRLSADHCVEVTGDLTTQITTGIVYVYCIPTKTIANINILK